MSKGKLRWKKDRSADRWTWREDRSAEIAPAVGTAWSATVSVNVGGGRTWLETARSGGGLARELFPSREAAMEWAERVLNGWQT